MRPLVFQGIAAAFCHDQLQAFLAQHSEELEALGMPDATGFLAEPVHDQSGLTDWYMEGETSPVPLTSLPEEEQNAVRRTLGRYARALGQLLDRSSLPGSQEGMAAGLLKEALHFPSENDIYVCEGRPVLINWGFAAGEQGAAPQDIMRLAAARPPAAKEPAAAVPPAEDEPPNPGQASPAPVATPLTAPAGPAAAPAAETRMQAAAPVPPPPAGAAPSVRPIGCLSWLLPLFLLLLLLWLLLAALGHFPSPLPESCFRQAVPADNEILRGRALDDELARILPLLTERARLCRPARPEEPPKAEQPPVVPELPEAPPPEEPGAEPLPPEELPFFGAVPAQPEPPRAPEKVPPKKPEPPRKQPVKEPPKETPKPLPEPKKPPKAAPAVPKGHNLEIPRDAPRNNDLSFLEGCWRSVTDLYNNNGTPIEGEYCFDRNGKGRRFVRQENGVRCSGSARARFQGSRLHIESDWAACRGKQKYVPQNIDCQGTGASTSCQGRDSGGGLHSRWKAGFVKK